jgi:alkanesulfonate monooxygenase SsuD/methylene tetrahydromethanopterin reductase-like flavin-dependent oxidoreductase (luciferase family)
MNADRPPEFSISLQNRGRLAQPATLVPLAERADALGFDAVWATDHVVMPRVPARLQGVLDQRGAALRGRVRPRRRRQHEPQTAAEAASTDLDRRGGPPGPAPRGRARRRLDTDGPGPPGANEPAGLAAAVRDLHELLAERERDPGSVTIAVKLPLRFGAARAPRALMTGDPEQIADDLRRYRASGVQHFALDFLATDPAEMHDALERFALEVRPHVP